MHGFTILETVIVLGLAAAISTVTIFGSVGLYQQSLSRSEANEAVSELRAARAVAQSGACSNECASVRVGDETVTFRIFSSLPIAATTIRLHTNPLVTWNITVDEVGSLSKELYISE